ncbi:MAG: N-acetylmuramoyl-L-alanine amidase [Oscillospiraceae bacterium]
MSKTVCIDAGHGGRDSGAVNKSRYEKYDTLKLANILKSELSKLDVNVIMTRTEDKYVSLSERTDFANKNKADLFISIHRNAFTSDSANGVEIWIYVKTDENTERCAKGIINELEAVGIQSDRGVKRGNFHVTRETKMPACLLELGFISNPKDNELFESKIYLYAKAIAKAVCEHLGICVKEDEVIQENNCADGASCRLYRVQVGAYKNEENANKVVAELKEKGYSAFVV